MSKKGGDVKIGIINYKHKDYPIFFRIGYDNQLRVNIGIILCCNDFTEKEIPVDYIIERVRLGLLQQIPSAEWHRAVAFCQFGREYVNKARKRS